MTRKYEFMQIAYENSEENGGTENDGGGCLYFEVTACLLG